MTGDKNREQSHNQWTNIFASHVYGAMLEWLLYEAELETLGEPYESSFRVDCDL